MRIIMGMSLYNYYVEAKKLRGLYAQTLQFRSLISQKDICLGIPVNYNYGYKSDDKAVISEYVIISYLLCPKVDVDVSTLCKVFIL